GRGLGERIAEQLKRFASHGGRRNLRGVARAVRSEGRLRRIGGLRRLRSGNRPGRRMCRVTRREDEHGDEDRRGPTPASGGYVVGHSLVRKTVAPNASR